MADPIRIVIVDDHIVVRCGLRLMLMNQPGLSVEADADSAAAALRLLQARRFDVALVNISLPDKNGLDLLRQLRDLYPSMAVLMVSAHQEEVYGIRALKLGAAGYLNRSCSPEVLAEAVRKTAAGGKYVTPSLMEQLAGMLGGGNTVASHDQLTDRELQILRPIAAGESLVGIATSVHLSPSTVTTYRARILSKMGWKSNAELIRYALDHRLA